MKPRIWPYFIGLIGDSLISSGFRIMIAFILKDLVDAAVQGDKSLLIRAIIIICISVVLVSSFSSVLGYIYKRCIKSTIAEIRLKIFKHIEELPIRYFESNHRGDIISRTLSDIQSAEGAYSTGVSSVVTTFLQGVGSIIAMVILEWRVALILVILGALSAIINVLFSIPLRSVSDNIQRKFGPLNSKLIDMLSGKNIIKIFNLNHTLERNYDKENSDLSKELVKQTYIHSCLESVNNLIARLSLLGVIIFGIVMVLNDMYSIGTITAMLELAGGITGMFLALGGYIAQLQSSLAGVDRIFELLSVEAEPEKLITNETADNNSMIRMEEVDFCYQEDKIILNKTSFSVNLGEFAAFVGHSGSGKSTIIKLLLGFYSVPKGSIIIDGKSIGCYTLEELRDKIAYVPQEAYLFEGSIEGNIRYGRPGASHEEVTAAAKAAYAHEFILEQPDGYNTMVGESGVRLSGGQKQRISIARALLKNAPILLLDEATSSLDSESEELVQKAANVLIKGRTTIAVSHRLSSIEGADMIFVLDKGNVVESGRHDELLYKGGVYKQLHDMQFLKDDIYVEPLY